MKPRRGARVFVLVIALAWVSYPLFSADQTTQAPSRYLFTWVGDEGRENSDFLAVVDRRRQGDRPVAICCSISTTQAARRAVSPS